MHSPCHRTFSLKRVAGLSFPARVERAQFHRARSASKKDGLAAPFISFRGCCLLTVSSRWGVIDLLLRASNEGSPRPRVARAQKIPQPPPSNLQHSFPLHRSLGRGAAEADLYCAHRTSTFLVCAFCEQEGHLAAAPSVTPPFVPSQRSATGWPPQ